ncbi:hypothetical protein [Halobacillus sp. Marseille-Q1614]|uniref:hypothetical protein n=1 Tax=Halobacillus sp. Marseille-Q1614 TaxID=2709134 RepID=UPI00156EA6D9|nr:hypothetical protein [Halobacillus sp. Marseille-Q1614]
MDNKEISNKLKEWKNLNLHYLQQINELTSTIKKPANFQVISYFTYSMSVDHTPAADNICLGSFHLTNLGNVPLHNPYICIKLSDDHPFKFSGKYVYKGTKQKMKLGNAWERFNEGEDVNTLFWLKPTEANILKPLETLVFSNFLVEWKSSPSYKGSIMGFVYGDELKEGESSLNQINISGKVGEEKQNG